MIGSSTGFSDLVHNLLGTGGLDELVERAERYGAGGIQGSSPTRGDRGFVTAGSEMAPDTQGGQRTVTGVAIALIVLLTGQVTHADDAAVLPKGLWRLLANSEIAFNWTERYNDNGDKEPLAADFNANLNSTVFPALAVFGPNASLGQSVVSYTRGATLTTFQPAYGLTDRLSVGVNIPYWTLENRVSASLNTSSATVGKCSTSDTLFPLGACPGGGTSVPLTTADVQKILSTGLDVNGDGDINVAGLGFQPLQSWSYSGIGDIEVGGRYQYYRGQNFRAAFTGGARFPTGRVDDPNNLADVGIGAGAYALLFQFQQDLMFQREGLGKRLGFPEPGDFFINTTFKYDLVLPDKQLLRICDPNFPLCSATEVVNRDVGDIFQAEIQPKVGLFFRGLIFSALYKYGQNFKDHITGSRGLNYGAAAKETNSTEQMYVLGLTFSTIPYIRGGDMKLVPFSLSVLYRNRFAGTNAPANQTITINFQYFFRIPA